MTELIGAPVARVGGEERVNGEQRYVADIHLPDELHAKLVTLPVAHARIRVHRCGAALALPGVRLVFTAADLPQPVAALWTAVQRSAGHRDRRGQVPRRPGRGGGGGNTRRCRGSGAPGARSTTRSYRPSSRSPARSRTARRSSRTRRLRPNDPLANTNVLREHSHRLGRCATARRPTSSSSTPTDFPMVTHFAIEPHAFVAAPDGDGLAIWTSIQHPYWLQRVMAKRRGHAAGQGAHPRAGPRRRVRRKAARQVRAPASRSWRSNRAGPCRLVLSLEETLSGCSSNGNGDHGPHRRQQRRHVRLPGHRCQLPDRCLRRHRRPRRGQGPLHRQRAVQLAGRAHPRPQRALAHGALDRVPRLRQPADQLGGRVEHLGGGHRLGIDQLDIRLRNLAHHGDKFMPVRHGLPTGVVGSVSRRAAELIAVGQPKQARVGAWLRARHQVGAHHGLSHSLVRLLADGSRRCLLPARRTWARARRRSLPRLRPTSWAFTIEA